jgi:catechol 2,3-dioxygenase-like lactoylglutathione lyase family enzyme
VQIERFDHIVLTVADLQASCAFYERVLGMQMVTFAGGRKALAFGDQKINLHERGREFEPEAYERLRSRPEALASSVALAHRLLA